MNHLDVHPVRFNKNRVRRVYLGGRILDEWQNIKSNEDRYLPEEWIASTVVARNIPTIPNEGLSIIKGDKKLSINEYIKKYPIEVLGEKHFKKFGTSIAILSKIIDSSERLSIQVHPTKEFAKNIMNSDYGKTESWYILGGRKINNENPYVLFGFKPGITKEKWRDLFNKQDIEGMINALHKIEVKEGDIFLIEGGVPHAIGPGCLLLELQEPTDYTMRTEKTLPDGSIIPDELCHQGYGYDHMLNCFNYLSYSRKETLDKWSYTKNMKNKTFGGTLSSLITYKNTECFSMDILEVKDSYTLKTESFVIGFVTEGRGKLSWGKDSIDIKKADSFLIPYINSEVEFIKNEEDNLKVVLCYPPK